MKLDLFIGHASDSVKPGASERKPISKTNKCTNDMYICVSVEKSISKANKCIVIFTFACLLKASLLILLCLARSVRLVHNVFVHAFPALRCPGVLSPLEFSGLAGGDCCMRNSREIWGPNLPIGPGKSEVMPIWAIWKSQKADMGDMADMDLVTATENESRYEMPI